jgi:hypothetical protein
VSTKTLEVMPIEAFIGGCGHVVLLQEWPDISVDTYIRLFVRPEDADQLCQQIMALATREISK